MYHLTKAKEVAVKTIQQPKQQQQQQQQQMLVWLGKERYEQLPVHSNMVLVRKSRGWKRPFKSF